jgi:hypothetical protein
MILQHHETFGSLGNHIHLPLFEADLERPSLPGSARRGRVGVNYESSFAGSIEWQT